MGITLGGLATGLDTNALIAGLRQAESVPLARNQAQQRDLKSARDALSSFLSKLVDIKTKAKDLDTAAEFSAYTITSSDDTSVVASSAGTAAPGSFSVQVNKLAFATRTKSKSVASATNALTQAGTIGITIAGTTTAVAVTSEDSLVAIATKINTSGAKVNASIVNEGSTSRLLISGKDSGVANQVTYAETGTVDLDLDLGANTYQNAQDAEIKIDNQFTVTRPTNKFTDVVQGVTITPKKITGNPPVTEAPVTVTVAADAAAQEKKIRAFVDAYNSAVSGGHLAAGYGSIKAANKYLSGDSAVRTSLDAMAKLVSSKLPGFTGKYDMLASVGVSLTQKGSLGIDSAKLKAALDADPGSVAKVFVGDPDNSVKGAMHLMTEAIDKLATGKEATMNIRIAAFGGNIERLEGQEIVLNRSLDAFEQRLRKKFTDLESSVARINQQGGALSGLANLGFSRR
ncbi:MAG: hypothetical protein EXR75_00185 [Myxococcales bacterium]|nr:hypothetical protein [Myxococcales bacterium]